MAYIGGELEEGNEGRGRRIEERNVDEEERKKERSETEKKEGSELDEEKERKEGREGEKEKEGIWPSPDCFRFGQPCQPLGLQTERF